MNSFCLAEICCCSSSSSCVLALFDCASASSWFASFNCLFKFSIEFSSDIFSSWFWPIVVVRLLILCSSESIVSFNSSFSFSKLSTFSLVCWSMWKLDEFRSFWKSSEFGNNWVMSSAFFFLSSASSSLRSWITLFCLSFSLWRDWIIFCNFCISSWFWLLSSNCLRKSSLSFFDTCNSLSNPVIWLFNSVIKFLSNRSAALRLNSVSIKFLLIIDNWGKI